MVLVRYGIGKHTEAVMTHIGPFIQPTPFTAPLVRSALTANLAHTGPFIDPTPFTAPLIRSAR